MLEDRASLLAWAEATILFLSDQLELLGQWLIDYCEAGADRQDDSLWLTDDDNDLVGVAYCELERMTAGAWNLKLIATHADR